ncbi:MAG: GTP cyclohydrolase, FolE2/MptA family [Thiomonas sp.]
MHAPEKLFSKAAPLSDIQATSDRRNLPIQQVGVKGVRHPVLVRTAGGAAQPSVATFDLSVALPPISCARPRRSRVSAV